MTELESTIKMRLEQSGVDNLKEYSKILKKTAHYKDFSVYLTALVRDIVFGKEEVDSWKRKHGIDSCEATTLIERALDELEVLV